MGTGRWGGSRITRCARWIQIVSGPPNLWGGPRGVWGGERGGAGHTMGGRVVVETILQYLQYLDENDRLKDARWFLYGWHRTSRGIALSRTKTRLGSVSTNLALSSRSVRFVETEPKRVSVRESAIPRDVRCQPYKNHLASLTETAKLKSDVWKSLKMIFHEDAWNFRNILMYLCGRNLGFQLWSPWLGRPSIWYKDVEILLLSLLCNLFNVCRTRSRFLVFSKISGFVTACEKIFENEISVCV